MPYIHPPPLEDLPDSLSLVGHSKNAFCTPPLLSQVLLPPSVPLSKPPSVSATSLASTFHSRNAPSKDSSTSSPVDMADANATPWAMNNIPPTSHIAQIGSNQHHHHPQSAMDSPVTAGYDHIQNSLLYDENHNLTYPGSFFPDRPRSYISGLDLTGLPMNMPESYPPAAYQIEPQRSGVPSESNVHGQVLQLHGFYDMYDLGVKHEEYPDPGFSSPYDSDAATRASTPCGDLIGYKGGAEAAIDKEQPYAQLIYRALLDAPSHTMILREIYDWFKKNTDKAGDKETKGWQNSIRHNLSMNGAFEKVDQPCEEAKKGFMWRLTKDAVREGVKSTTRYRSKQPNKRTHRAHLPLPQRQASGARGGQAARRSARMRRNSRLNDGYRSEPFNLVRSVPSAFGDPFSPGISMVYPHSPYYTSLGTELDFECSQDDFGTTLGGRNMEPLAYRSYTGSPLAHATSIGGNTAHIQLPDNPFDPLFTNSPTPTVEEPRTPDSGHGRWEDDMVLGGRSYVFDTAYHEHPM